MNYMSQSRVSRSARRWAWVNRPFLELDNPVQRWLGNRMKEKRLQQRHRTWNPNRLIVRPAM